MKLKITNKILSVLDVSKKLAFLSLLGLGFQSYAQDTCLTALPIEAGTTTVGTINGTNITTSCSNSAFAEWYSYTPDQNYRVTISSDLSANICKDTHFMVYTGACGAFTCYTSDDDSGIITCNVGNTNSFLSIKSFDVAAGVTYYIAWDSRWSMEGFDFTLTEATAVPNPCITATQISAGVTTVPEINGPNIITACSTAQKAEWFSYTPTQSYRVTISSDLPANICKDTYFSIYTGSCAGPIACVASDDNSGNLACNVGNTNSNLSKKVLEVVAGTTYYIAWDNRWSAAGFDFELTEEVIVIPVTYNPQTIPTLDPDFDTYNICIVDMNKDGKDDIVSVTDNLLRIHYQGAGGELIKTDFTMPPSMMPSWSLAAGDLNKDGYNDLLLGSSSGLSFWQSNSTGTAYQSITPGQDIFCQRTNFVDLNNDGNLDAFSCHDINPNVYYLNDGAGNYVHYQSGVTPGAYSLGITPTGGNYASIWSDYDNDGDVDMFISKCSGPPCELHRNDGNGIFTDISTTAQINFQPVDSWSSAMADFDNDGDMDILVGTNGGGTPRLFRNNLDTTNNVEEPFTNITAGSGWDTTPGSNRDFIAYDFDNDGFVDVMGASGKIMFNKGNSTFSATNYPGLSVGAVGDLNNDGFLDILNNNVVRYAIPNGNNWCKVLLTGVQSNTNGIGARLELYGAWGKQIRDVRSGEGFEFMSSLNGHFGLGSATAIDKLIVRWPSGAVDTILNPAINKGLEVKEGETLSNVEINSNSFSIFPNPTSDLLNVKLGSALAELKSTEIYDLSGRLVMNTTIANNAISVKSLATGTYVLLLKTKDGKQYSQKFLKK